jgi:hypothetical protein
MDVLFGHPEGMLQDVYCHLLRCVNEKNAMAPAKWHVPRGSSHANFSYGAFSQGASVSIQHLFLDFDGGGPLRKYWIDFEGLTAFLLSR